jgi:tetratricopeptide (TPR) repeat protein
MRWGLHELPVNVRRGRLELLLGDRVVRRVPGVRREDRPATHARLVRQGVSAYVGGDLSTAYDSLRTAYEKNPSSQNLMNFTNRIARQAGMPTVEPPRDSMAGARWTLVDQKLHDALTAIYEGRYDVSIAKCEQVLRIDPNNVTAIGRMGASFFLLGEKDKAVTLWKRALELEPNNQTAIDYLRQMGAYQE